MKIARGTVYSTGQGRTCPQCGWPLENCRCAASLDTPEEPVPARIAATLRIEHRGGGKSVTVVDGLPRNRPFLETLARDLKKTCGTGGRCGESFVELQGDQRERLRDLLARRGWSLRG
ncbi:MAG TPA: translation initiation factor [Thermoanaerobaculia bacterium]|nr:translation initiation factor [Thermoanaerobaculia bacterium]